MAADAHLIPFAKLLAVALLLAASFPAAQGRQETLLNDLSCDAICTSHNMPAPKLMRRRDELGFMLIVESFDEWKSPKVRKID